MSPSPELTEAASRWLDSLRAVAAAEARAAEFARLLGTAVGRPGKPYEVVAIPVGKITAYLHADPDGNWHPSYC